eukprot:2983072-Alexandrium_andersonii.AAC.1
MQGQLLRPMRLARRRARGGSTAAKEAQAVGLIAHRAAGHARCCNRRGKLRQAHRVPFGSCLLQLPSPAAGLTIKAQP